MSKIPMLPTSLPGGEMLPYMSARRRHEICDVVFENLGGVERLTHEADRSADAYWTFMNFWGKGLPRAVSTEHTVSDGLEILLARLDAGEGAEVIEGSCEEVSDAKR